MDNSEFLKLAENAVKSTVNVGDMVYAFDNGDIHYGIVNQVQYLVEGGHCLETENEVVPSVSFTSFLYCVQCGFDKYVYTKIVFKTKEDLKAHLNSLLNKAIV